MTNIDPSWAAILAEPPDRACVHYSVGEANGANSAFGELTLRLWPDGPAVVVQRLRENRRAWDVVLDSSVFPAVWAALRFAGFPVPPDAPIRPGGARILWVDAGALNGVVAFPRGDSGTPPPWQALGALLEGVIAQVDPGIAWPHQDRLDPCVLSTARRHGLAATMDADPGQLRARWNGSHGCHVAVVDAIREHRAWEQALADLPRAGEVRERRDLRGIRTGPAELPGARLDGACLRDADLRYTRLPGASLQEASLVDADLSASQLQEANLFQADLRGASLLGARLNGADLREADLRGADLRGAKLEGARLEGALHWDTRVDPGVVLDRLARVPLRHYSLTPGERAFLEGAFAKPFLVEDLEDRDRFRGYLPVQRMPDGQIILRAPSRAMVQVGVIRGWAAAWVATEGGDAFRLDRVFSHRFLTAQARRLVATLLPGKPLEAALGEAGGPDMPTISQRKRQPRDGGGWHVLVLFDESGAVLAETTDEGAIIQAEVCSGATAFDLRMEWSAVGTAVG